VGVLALLMAAVSTAGSAAGQTQQGAGGAPGSGAAAAKPAEISCAAMAKKLEDWPQLSRYAAANASLPGSEAGRVVFYGDSITDAWVRNGGKFFPGKAYVNRGISGQTTEQMVVRFRQDVVNLHPAAVVILAGTNDIAGNTGTETAETIEDGFRSMVDLARANGIKVVLASVLPVATYPWRPGVADPPGRIKALNAWLQSYAVEQKVVYLDYYTAMAGPDGGMKPGISIDGVHPNAAGYAIMEPLAEAAVEKVVQ
jgi:lysophospholipase L1-like esterase